MFRGENYDDHIVERLAEEAILEGKDYFYYVDDNWNEWELYVYDIFDEEDIKEIKENKNEERPNK